MAKKEVKVVTLDEAKAKHKKYMKTAKILLISLMVVTVLAVGVWLTIYFLQKQKVRFDVFKNVQTMSKNTNIETLEKALSKDSTDDDGNNIEGDKTKYDNFLNSNSKYKDLINVFYSMHNFNSEIFDNLAPYFSQITLSIFENNDFKAEYKKLNSKADAFLSDWKTFISQINSTLSNETNLTFLKEDLAISYAEFQEEFYNFNLFSLNKIRNKKISIPKTLELTIKVGGLKINITKTFLDNKKLTNDSELTNCNTFITNGTTGLGKIKDSISAQFNNFDLVKESELDEIVNEKTTPKRFDDLIEIVNKFDWENNRIYDFMQTTNSDFNLIAGVLFITQ
jgi:hypothetical protein